MEYENWLKAWKTNISADDFLEYAKETQNDFLAVVHGMYDHEYDVSDSEDDEDLDEEALQEAQELIARYQAQVCAILFVRVDSNALTILSSSLPSSSFLCYFSPLFFFLFLFLFLLDNNSIRRRTILCAGAGTSTA